MWMIFVICIGSMAFTAWLSAWVLGRPEGPNAMRTVATAIREGAEGFLATQYSAIMRYAAAMAVLLYLLYLTKPTNMPGVSTGQMAFLTTACFLTGAVMR